MTETPYPTGIAAMPEPRRQRAYDHRPRELVSATGDTSIAIDLGVPRSTATGWLHAEPREVVTMAVLDAETVDLQAQVLKLRRRVRILVAVVGLLLALVRVSGVRLDSRLLSGTARKAVLRAIRRGRRVLPLRAGLRVLRISPSSFHGWKTDGSRCRPGDRATCPRRSPNQLTPDEISAIRDMVTSPSYRHVPTSRLAVLAQRLGKVFASPSTWNRLVRQRGWRRPRQRVHPGRPKVGLRASRPDEAWHVDTTVIRLLDGTKAYVHAVIDNFSRRILAFRVAERFDIANALSILVDAARQAVRGDGEASVPMLVVDGGVENYNGGVDGLIEQGILRRVLALTELRFSNSLIEAFWRQMKHQWLFLNTLDSVASVRRHVALSRRSPKTARSLTRRSPVRPPTRSTSARATTSRASWTRRGGRHEKAGSPAIGRRLAPSARAHHVRRPRSRPLLRRTSVPSLCRGSIGSGRTSRLRLRRARSYEAGRAEAAAPKTESWLLETGRRAERAAGVEFSNTRVRVALTRSTAAGQGSTPEPPPRQDGCPC